MSRSKTSIHAWQLALLCVFALAASLVCTSAAYASTPQVTLKTQASEGALTAGQISTQEETPADDAEKDPREAPEAYSFGIGADIEKATVTFTGGSTFAYTGKEIEPKFTATLTKDGKTRTLVGTSDPNNETADFFYFYMNNVDVSLGKTLPVEDQPVVVLATFVADAPFVYVKEAPFTIKPASMKGATVKIPSQWYTGKRLRPVPSVKFQGMTLQRGKDYTVKYKKNIKVGTAKAIIIGKGNFAGNKVAKFRIKKASIANAKFSRVKDKIYTGKSIAPNVKVKYKGKMLKKNKDYTISYRNNRNAGIATITIKGKGNMRGVHRIYFAIEPRPIDDLSQAYVNSVTWTGSFLEPNPVLKYKGNKLQSGRDYTVSYSDNVEPGRGHAYVTARGNYTGSRILTFEIDKRKVDYYKGTPVLAWMPYNKYIYSPSLRPKPIVTYNGNRLVENVDYFLSWDNSNYSKGQGCVIIYGSGTHFTGKRIVSYYIVSS